ncbi:conserved hypothetical protein (plasmid) [Arthrobacter sp. Hiyo8]|nr:conserved hypothetical protein [Arthrobacter sp. Hiyo8]
MLNEIQLTVLCVSLPQRFTPPRSSRNGAIMKTRSTIHLVAAGIAALLAMTGCGGAAPGSQTTEVPKTQNTRDISEGVQPDPAAVALLPKSYKDEGELVVAMDLSSPPMTFLAQDNVTPIGLNPDLARLVAKKLGLKLKFENTAFDTIIPASTAAATTSLPPPCPPPKND